MISKEKFSQEVDELHVGSYSYLDAILELCKKYEIEVVSANKFITASLKKKIEAEAVRLNLIKREHVPAEVPNVGWLETV